MLFAFFIVPIIVYGIRYTEKLFDRRYKIIEKVYYSDKTPPNCAKEAALAVARNWNPGLTFNQQKDAIYKVADFVYNSVRLPRETGILVSAVPGIHIRKPDGTIIETSLSSNNQIQYLKSEKYLLRSQEQAELDSLALWNPYFGLWLCVDKATQPVCRISKLDEVSANSSASNCTLVHHDIYTEPFIPCTEIVSGYPTINYFNSGTKSGAMIFSSFSDAFDTLSFYSSNQYGSVGAILSKLSQESSGRYTVRSTDANSNNVQISVVDDAIHLGKIKVCADADEACAVPAQCNVDIIFAIPVNAAACSTSNDNKNVYVHVPPSDNKIPPNIKKTPVYQIGQACRTMIKNHFYHTRGVYMSLIPYSGKLSVSPDRAVEWTTSFPQFQNNDQKKIIGAGMYATSGILGKPLLQDYKTKTPIEKTDLPTSDTPYYWGSSLTGHPIMFRRGEVHTDPVYGANQYYSGILLSTMDPAEEEQYKYLRMNLNPCTPQAADIISMSCIKDCTNFLPNPYYLIELTADLVKIYEMCNALYPIGDPHNSSNFIFMALEWANNMFQNWTNDPQQTMITSSDGDAALGSQSKSASDRKKVVVLLVNKPDYFAPDELTYVGFYNDKQTVTFKNDCIDFALNQGTSLSSTDNLLKFGSENNKVTYSSENLYYSYKNDDGITANCILKINKDVKTFIKLTVAPCCKINLVKHESDLYDICSDGWFSYGAAGVGPIEEDGSDMLVVSNVDGTTAYSDDGLHWNLLRYWPDNPDFTLETLPSDFWCFGTNFNKVFKNNEGSIVAYVSDNGTDINIAKSEQIEEIMNRNGYSLKMNYSFNQWGYEYRDVAYALVEESSNKVITYSYDGTDWYSVTTETRYGNVNNNWSGRIGDVLYKNIKYLSTGNTYFYSLDGSNWYSKEGSHLTISSYSGFADGTEPYEDAPCIRDSDNSVVLINTQGNRWCSITRNTSKNNYTLHESSYFKDSNEKVVYYKCFNDQWTENTSNFTSSTLGLSSLTRGSSTVSNGYKFHDSIFHNFLSNQKMYSFDSINYYYSRERPNIYYAGMRYGNGVWVRIKNTSDNPIEISSDYCKSWTNPEGNSIFKTPASDAYTHGKISFLGFANGVFMTAGSDGYIYTSTNGVDWIKKGYLCDDAKVCAPGLAYGKNKWIASAGMGFTYESYDNGDTWTYVDNTLRNMPGHSCYENYLIYIYGIFYSKYCGSQTAMSFSGGNWTKVSSDPVYAYNLVVYNGKMYSIGYGSKAIDVLNSDGGGCFTWVNQEISSENSNFFIEFNNLANTSADKIQNDKYTVDKQKTFIIEADQIPETVDANGYRTVKFEICNLQLISAETVIVTHSNDTGNIVLETATTIQNPTQAAKAETKAAYLKLKETGASVYLVKYRTNEGTINNETTNSTETEGSSNAVGSGENLEAEIENDISYLSECADFVYEASNEEELENILNEIAIKIKNEANYENAQIVN